MERVKHKTKISVFLLIAFFTSVFLVPTVSSASPISFSVSPQKFEVELFPGETYRSKIKVGNRSDLALPVSTRALTFDAAEDTGAMIFLPPGEMENSPGLWINFESPDFILESGESREIFFEIRVPQEVMPRGYSAFVIFQPNLPNHYFEDGGVARVIPVLGVPFLISVKNLYLDLEPKNELEVLEFTLSPEERIAFWEKTLGFLEGSVFPTVSASDVQATSRKPESFNLRVRNNSEFHLRPKGTAVIKNFWGGVVGEVAIPEKTILPGRVRIFPVEFQKEESYVNDGWLGSLSEYFSQRMFAGRYRIDLDLSSPHITGSEHLEARVNKSLVLYSFPLATSIIFLILAAFLFFIVFKHGRVKKAVRAFFLRQKT